MRILPKGNYVNGSFIKPSQVDGYIERVSPADLSDSIGRFAVSVASAQAAVEAALAAFPDWRDAPPDERAAALRRYSENLDTHRDRLANAIVRETGKPHWEAQREVDLMRKKVDITLEDGLADVAAFGSGGTSGVCRYRPMGVVAVLAPFNYPGHLPNGHFVPALATGCTVVMKPSQLTPATGQIMADIIDRSKLPRGVFNLVQGEGSTVGHALATDDRVRVVALTGSTSVGRKIQAETAHQDKILALEMGGKNATIVLDDADLDRAAYEIAMSAFITTGQRCTCTSRVIAQDTIVDELTEKLKERTEAIRVGFPFDDDVFCGPLVSENARAGFLEAIEGGRAEGAEVVVEGGPLELEGHAGCYVRPSIHRVKKADPASRYQLDEHFGPDLCIVPVSDDDEAIAVNAMSRFGLALSVFTADRTRYDYIRVRSREGCINLNSGTVGASSRLPFGGTKDSGNYRASALHAVRYCTYPVSSIEDERTGNEGLTDLPGFPSAS